MYARGCYKLERPALSFPGEGAHSPRRQGFTSEFSMQLRPWHRHSAAPHLRVMNVSSREQQSWLLSSLWKQTEVLRAAVTCPGLQKRGSESDGTVCVWGRGRSYKRKAEDSGTCLHLLWSSQNNGPGLGMSFTLAVDPESISDLLPLPTPPQQPAQGYSPGSC